MVFFGTSGIRDLSPEILDCNFAFKFGQAISNFKKKFIIGYDGRPTGQMLLNASIAGLLQQGKDVYNLDLCTSPTLANYSNKLNTIGIMITASHNPLCYNGIKIFENGKEFDKNKEKKLESILEKKITTKPVQWNKVGKIFFAQEDAKASHISLLEKIFDINTIKQRKIRILLDCANLAAVAVAPMMFRKFDAIVLEKNCTPFLSPDRAIEPNYENLKKLSQEIKNLDIDFAIAFDGDGDRAVVLDEKGEMIGLDVQLAIAIDYILEKTKAKAVVCTVESSLLIKDIVKKHNAKLFLTPVGSRNVAIKMRQTNAVFGGEPCGEYIFKNALSSPDGLATSLLFAEIFSKKESLHNLKKIYKTYPIKRLKISCQKNQKSLFMKKLEKNWPFKTKLKIDGLMAHEDWGWVLVRPSGTENFIRITIEAYTQKDLDQNLKKLEEVING